jgi:hypothetical protein
VRERGETHGERVQEWRRLEKSPYDKLTLSREYRVLTKKEF